MRCPFHHRDDHLVAVLHAITTRIHAMSAELEALTAAVTESNRVSEAALVLIDGIKAQLDAALVSADPRALQSLSDSLGVESAKLAAKEAALSPPAPAPAPAPVADPVPVAVPAPVAAPADPAAP